MLLSRGSVLWTITLLAASAQSPGVQRKSVNPAIARVVEEVSEERIAAIMKRLEAFGTRNTFSETDHPARGIGAARRWIAEEFRGYGKRLEVRFDKHAVKKGGRVWRDVEVVNVVARLAGKLNPEREVVVSAHYDSLNRIPKPKPPEADPLDSSEEDNEPTSRADAPGVNDDGSGTAAVMELARVMSRYEWDNTILFIAFDAEEYGLVGSRHFAGQAKKDDRLIEAVLNNDIIGSEVAGNGRAANRAVNVYSNDPADSLSRQVARYVRETGGRYVPGMRVDAVFRADRFGRGGDHTSFDNAGFGAVRFTTPAEDYSKQHNPKDTFANASPGYTARVAQVNAAALAGLALAPAPPVVTRIGTVGPSKGRRLPNLSRGKSGYDARIRWTPGKAEADLAGFAIVMRATTAPFWEHEIYVGNVTEYVMKDVPIDDCVIGVKAVDKDGNESLVSAYAIAPRTDASVQ